MNVYIYYGSLTGFREVMPKKDEDYMPIVDLAILDDSRHRNIKVEVEGRNGIEDEELLYFDNVVAFSDDYSSLTESTIESFANFVFRYEINNLYLQNPPDSIAKRMKQYIKNECIPDCQKYKNLGMDELRKVKTGFPEAVIGQYDAQQHVLGALYNVAKGRYNKPCVILFYGSTGVGKTETAKYIAEVIGQPLFRKQFSMLHSDEFSSYIFGGKHNQNSLAKELL